MEKNIPDPRRKNSGQEKASILFTLFLFTLLFFRPFAVIGEGTAVQFTGYPEIRRLFITDQLYKEHQNDIQEYHKAAARKEPLPPLNLYTYSVKSGDDLYGISARLNLPYETIATLNGIEQLAPLQEGKRLLIPNLPGIFLPEKPKTELDYLIAAVSRRMRSLPMTITVQKAENSGESYAFYPGRRFSKEELAFFLGILFRFPLEKGEITSYYGTRIHPFAGEPRFHGGIDIAGPMGTSIVAARKGEVIALGRDEILGNYVILAHTGGYQTVYGHLESINVELHERVNSGMIIAALGNTGMSTGPHLHFEIRRNGSAKNPLPLMSGSGR